MTSRLNRVRSILRAVPADSRRHFARIDPSPARYDDGAWLR